MLPAADVVSLHVAFFASTRKIIGRSQIAAMRRGSVDINAARGGVLDEEAVIEAPCSGQLDGAAYDVFETEPMDATGGARFAQAPNPLLTPHIAGVTEESNVRVSDLIARRVLDHLAGKPRP